MKKIFGALISAMLAIVLSFSLVACNNEESTVDKTLSATEAVTFLETAATSLMTQVTTAITAGNLGIAFSAEIDGSAKIGEETKGITGAIDAQANIDSAVITALTAGTVPTLEPEEDSEFFVEYSAVIPDFLDTGKNSMYYKDGMQYTSTNTNGTETKLKKEISIFEIVAAILNDGGGGGNANGGMEETPQMSAEAETAFNIYDMIATAIYGETLETPTAEKIAALSTLIETNFPTSKLPITFKTQTTGENVDFIIEINKAKIVTFLDDLLNLLPLIEDEIANTTIFAEIKLVIPEVELMLAEFEKIQLNFTLNFKSAVLSGFSANVAIKGEIPAAAATSSIDIAMNISSTIEISNNIAITPPTDLASYISSTV